VSRDLVDHDQQRRSRRANRILTGIAIVVVALVVTATIVVVTGDDGGGGGGAQVAGELGLGERALGEAAPSFTAPTVTGTGDVRLADHRGRVVVLNFWRSDCTPCRDEFPVLARVAERGNADVIGLSTDAIPADARRFAREERAEWPLGLDADLTIAEAFGLRVSLPQTFFIRTDGTVAYRIYGRLDDELVREGLRAARTPA
jgi:cytochrome c biogenesis protein CcmG/thiol:disulfide interchange protein DsbE